MKIKFGAIITDGCGKLGGHFISRNHYGRFQGTVTVPTNPQTAFQQARRTQLSVLTANWRSLTEAQRIAWRAEVGNYERTNCVGDIYTLTGQTLYIGLNMNLWMVGEASIDEPDVKVLPTDPGDFTLSILADGSEFKLSFAVAPNDPRAKYIIYASPSLSPGIQYVSTKYRSIAAISDSGGTDYNLNAEYATRFTFPLASQAAWAKVLAINIDCGAAGIPYSAQGISA